MAVLACMLFGCADSGGKGEPGSDIRETAEGRRREITFPLNEQITITAMVRDFNRDRTREIDRILEDISVQISERNEALPNAVQRLLDAMEYDVPYTSAALMEKLGMKSREGFRRNCLHPALQMNLVQMTIPDKPNSRNQRYVKI